MQRWGYWYHTLSPACVGLRHFAASLAALLPRLTLSHRAYVYPIMPLWDGPSGMSYLGGKIRMLYAHVASICCKWQVQVQVQVQLQAMRESQTLWASRAIKLKKAYDSSHSLSRHRSGNLRMQPVCPYVDARFKVSPGYIYASPKLRPRKGPSAFIDESGLTAETKNEG